MHDSVDRSKSPSSGRGAAKLNLVLVVGAVLFLGVHWYGAELERYGNGARQGGKSAQLLRQLKADSRTFIAAVRFLVERDPVVAPMPGEPMVPEELPSVAMPTNGVAGVPQA